MEKQPTSELWDKATALHAAGQLEQAEKLYVTLLEQNPDNTNLLATIGSLYLQTGRKGLAIHFLGNAIKNDPKDEGLYTNLGIVYKQANLHKKSEEAFEQSIAIKPTPEALSNYSALFIEAGQDEKCIRICEQALAMNNEVPVAHWNLSISLLANGVWERGWDEYEWGLRWIGLREDRKVACDVPWWDGTPDKTVYIYGEQGLGDEIMFASMLPDIIKTNKVILECHPRLVTMFKAAFPEIVIYGTRTSMENVTWAKDHQIDYRMPIGSLAKFYRRNADTFNGMPYLKTDPIKKSDKFRVGISWTGGLKPGRVEKRTVPLSWWTSILNVPNVEFVSLQYTDAKADLDALDRRGYEVRTMEEHIKAEDYNETARVVASCDLVISCCTTVIHLAGALGIPCWCMAPRWPAWRYQNSGKIPWYRSVRMYRCTEVGQDAWMPVIQRVGYDLDELVSSMNRKRMVA